MISELRAFQCSHFEQGYVVVLIRSLFSFVFFSFLLFFLPLHYIILFFFIIFNILTSFQIVLNPAGGALASMKIPFYFGFGGVMGMFIFTFILQYSLILYCFISTNHSFESPFNISTRIWEAVGQLDFTVGCCEDISVHHQRHQRSKDAYSWSYQHCRTKTRAKLRIRQGSCSPSLPLSPPFSLLFLTNTLVDTRTCDVETRCGVDA